MRVRHDHHIHTVFSNHASADMVVPTIAAQAVEMGLGRIVILEHVPEIPRYRRAVLEQQIATAPMPQIEAIRLEVDRWRGRLPLRILVGAEIDANPHTRDGRLLGERVEGVDVVVASTHFLPGGEALWYDVKDLFASERLAEIYREWMVWIMHIAANPAVDVLAHPGVEMAAIGAIERFEGAVLEDFEKLLRVCARYDTAVELNELVYHKIGSEQAESYVSVIGLARDLGVRLSIGSDAHQLDRIGRYPWVQTVIERLGLTPDHFFQPQLWE